LRFWQFCQAANLLGQQSPAPVSAAAPVNASSLPQPMNWTAVEDHRNMMDQLGWRQTSSDDQGLPSLG
jgi:hypothetical protein